MFLSFFDKQLSRSLCFNFVHCIKNYDLVLARLPGISANSNENYRHCNFQDFANISGNFPEILNFWKIHNPNQNSSVGLCMQHYKFSRLAVMICATLGPSVLK